MIKFSLSINVALSQYPLLERIKLAAQLGYDGVDIYMDHKDFNAAEIRKASEECGIPVVSTGVNDGFVNTLDKDWESLRKAYEEAFSFAQGCGAAAVPALGGFRPGDSYSADIIILENAKRLAELAERRGITVMLEPINNVIEHRDAYLHTSAKAMEIVKAVDSPNFRLLYDFVHMESSEGNVINNSVSFAPFTQMYHAVGIPAHDEPFNSPLDYPYIFSKIDEAGFDGFVSAEYAASYDSYQSAKDVLDYLRSYKERPALYRSRGFTKQAACGVSSGEKKGMRF